MTDNTQLSRRRLIWTAGSMLLTTSLAGCTGDGDADQDDSDGDDGSVSDDSEDGSDTDNSPVDRTGQDTVTVEVGAGNGLQFAPAQIRISPGTTVIWEWTGVGGGHNVVASDDSFVSHQNRNTTAEAGYTFEHSFSESGRYEYVCQPHSKQGMVGSVEVVE